MSMPDAPLSLTASAMVWVISTGRASRGGRREFADPFVRGPVGLDRADDLHEGAAVPTGAMPVDRILVLADDLQVQQGGFTSLLQVLAPVGEPVHRACQLCRVGAGLQLGQGGDAAVEGVVGAAPQPGREHAQVAYVRRDFGLQDS
jgi:hypothetical protein